MKSFSETPVSKAFSLPSIEHSAVAYVSAQRRIVGFFLKPEPGA
jgi:hypothetical protein